MSSSCFSIQHHTVPCQHIRGYYRCTATSPEELLHLAVNQYTPLDNPNPQPGDVTIIAAHGAGCAKELYEPLFDDLYQLLRSNPRGPQIRGIWMADVATHGQSGMLNEGKVGVDFSWDDHSRDLLHMTNVFRKHMPQPLVGLGHSMGGTIITQLALLHPRLFSTIICIEPHLVKSFSDVKRFEGCYGITLKRDIWPSREAAIAQVQKSNVQRTWNPRVRERWENHALRNLPTLLYPEVPQDINQMREGAASAPATLTTTKHHEVRAFSRDAFPHPSEPLHHFRPTTLSHPELSNGVHKELSVPLYRPEIVLTCRQLPFLRPSILFLWGGKSQFSAATKENREEIYSMTGTEPGGSGGSRAGRTKLAVMEDGGHFLVFERPHVVAQEMATWLDQEIQRYRVEDEAERRAWETIGLRERAMVDENWILWMKKWYVRKPKQSSKQPKAAKL